jgi:porphobilinogen synthase
LPLFIHEGEEEIPIKSMPGCFRLSLAGMMKEVEGAIADGIEMIEVFPATDASVKTAEAEEAFNPQGLVPRAIRMLKEKWPTLVVVTDVALDPYNSDGHDGLVCKKTGRILNDESVAVLCKQAICHAEAGADIIAPSDMMDGRIGECKPLLSATHAPSNLLSALW